MDPRSARDATRGSSTMSNIRTEQPPSDSGLKLRFYSAASVSCNGGHRTRTCTGLRPAVFKTAALPVRSSPPDYAALELTAAGVARGVPMFAVEAQRHAEARSASSMMLYRFAPSNGPPQVRWDSLGCGRHRRSEEHTSELQSPDHLVCRLLLEKKKQKL